MESQETGEMTLTALPENPGLTYRTHTVAHNSLQSQEEEKSITGMHLYTRI